MWKDFKTSPRKCNVCYFDNSACFISNCLLGLPLSGERFVDFDRLPKSGPFPSEYDCDFEPPDYRYTWIGHANFRFGLPGITINSNQINLRIHKFPKITLDGEPRTMVQ